jgi:hypothetical protein
MSEIAAIAVTIAALAVLALVIRVFLLARRVQKVWERLDRTIESELTPGIRAWGDAGRGVQQAAGKLANGLSVLTRVIERADRVSEKLDSGVLLAPVLTRVSSWLAGVRRGLQVHQHKGFGRGRGGHPAEEEGEPGD